MIQKTEVPGLDLIASGTRTPQGPELLGSPAVSQLFMALRSNYGVILVDSPPLGAGVDALSLGTVAGTMVLVLRSGGAQSDATEARLDVAERLPIRLLGAVVNGAREGPDGAYPGYYIEDYEFAGVEDPGTPVIHGETAASRLGSGWVSRRG
jgi:Mrp family chromosome partitioning ATPase